MDEQKQIDILTLVETAPVILETEELEQQAMEDQFPELFMQEKTSFAAKVKGYLANKKARFQYRMRIIQSTTLWKISSFLASYALVSAGIFAFLLVSVNFQAYSELMANYLNPQSLKISSHKIFRTMGSSKIQVYADESEKTVEPQDAKNDASAFSSYSPQRLLTKKSGLQLDVEIVPYENRIIIPKIGKNIPLVDVDTRKQISINNLEDIFMNELQKGVIRYPGTAYPGEEGNAFIFGHSSNYPWIKGDYNDAFALLDNVVFGDDIIVYYKQKKYTYTVTEKKIVKPGDVQILQRQEGKKELSLMTCWPVGTTLNRMIVIAEIKNISN